jgi:site-specific DNA-methyltransferase (adenine-specific)
MKNRNLDHKDDWGTPDFFYKKLNNEFKFDFDPCPYLHDVEAWNGLGIDWGKSNFVNPPYSLKLKVEFVKKAIEQSKKGKLSAMLLPVSTSTKLFHELILPNAIEIRWIKGRVPFIGINKDGEYVNWHLWTRTAPDGVTHVRRNGQQDSMIVIFDCKKLTINLK